MAQKRWDDAVRLTGRLLELTESGERWGRVIELLILSALVLDAQDQPDEALEPLTRALTLAEPQDYVRIFVDEGESMARLLYRAAARGITPDYTGELLAAFQDLDSTPVAGSKAREPKSGIIESLSAREVEVLDCLTEGLSNREIAQRLTISLTTVKTHTRNIYRKLDVHSRTQAVARAKELGIT
jgi:LuxR family maltose regulon positive regulatory protein